MENSPIVEALDTVLESEFDDSDKDDNHCPTQSKDSDLSDSSSCLSRSTLDDVEDIQLTLADQTMYQWTAPADGNTLKAFTASPNEECRVSVHSRTPSSYYGLFLTDDIVDLIVEETNRNAHHILDSSRVKRSSRLNNWKDTDKYEIKKFLGLVLFMGLVKYPTVDDYWSKHVIYSNNFCSKVMSRNRFQILLRFIHFEDNQLVKIGKSKLYKVEKIVLKIVNNFKKVHYPGKSLVIDETLLPLSGRLGFRQYIPGKVDKYGIKIYKLTDPNGYTYDVEVDHGKSDVNADGTSKSTTQTGKLSTTNIRNRQEEEIKPDIIQHSKKAIDLSDQPASNFIPLRKTARWYHKIVFELLLNTAVVNSYVLYNKEVDTKIKIADFRKDIVMDLTSMRQENPDDRITIESKHTLISTEERTCDNRRKRSRCNTCYSELSEAEGPNMARKKAKLVATQCSKCPNKPYFCLKHFQEYHNIE